MLHWPKKSLVMPFYYINFDQNGPGIIVRQMTVYGQALWIFKRENNECSRN